MVDCDEDGIPVGWELVRLIESEIDDFVDAADRRDFERVNEIVDGAYARLFGPYVH